MKRVLFALPLAACLQHPVPSTPDDIPATPAQALALSATYEYAAAARVTVDRVRFADFIPLGGSAWTAAWADCRRDGEPQWISFYAPALERLGDADIRLAAAHEVCHVQAGDTLRCGRGDAAAKEVRATACAHELSGL
jgi:hypothetical protein